MKRLPSIGILLFLVSFGLSVPGLTSPPAEAAATDLIPSLALGSDIEFSVIGDRNEDRSSDLVFDASDRLWLILPGHRNLIRLDDDGKVAESVFTPEGKPNLIRLAADREGNLYAAGGSRLHRYSLQTKTWDPDGWSAPRSFSAIMAIACDASGNLYVADAKQKRIAVLSPDGSETRTYESEEFEDIGSIAVAPGGEIVCGIRDRIQVRSPEGDLLREWNQDERLPNSNRQPLLTVDAHGFIYAVNPDLPEFDVYDLEGRKIHHWKHSSARGIKIQDHSGIGITPSGRLAIAHTKTHVATFDVTWKPEDEVIPPVPEREKGPNLLLVTMDTTRPDHLGCYGYNRDTSPVIDRIAAGGVRFAEAFCQAPDTCASHASMLTSLYPFVHRARNTGFYLHEEFTTLAEILHGAGYRTGAFLSGFTLTSHHTWLDQGFDVYDNYDSIHDATRTNDHAMRPADVTTGFAVRWLEENRGKRVFLWVHYFDPHSPYNPPEEYTGLFDWDREDPDLRKDRKTVGGTYPRGEIIARYDGEIRFMDTEIGHLLDAMDTLGYSDELLAIFVGDHGELLGEHGAWAIHGNTLLEAEIRIPFLVSAMGVPGIVQPAVRSEPAETIDILPTFLDAAGIEIPAVAQGTSLLPWLRGEARPWPREFVWSQLCKQAAGDSFVYGSIRAGDWKYRGHARRKSSNLYHLATDPGEDKNLAAKPASVRELLGVPEDEIPEELRNQAGKMVLHSIAPGLEEYDDLYKYPKEEHRAMMIELFDTVTGWPSALLPQIGGDEPTVMDAERQQRLRKLGYIGH